MAGRVCPKCGSPLPSDVQFCPSCGTPVPHSGKDGSSTPATPSAPSPPGSIRQSSLEARLGVEGLRSFLLQRQLFLGGHNYQVLTSEKKLLFTVEEDIHEELEWNLLDRPPRQPSSGPPSDKALPEPPLLMLVSTLTDSSGVPQAKISIQLTGTTAVSALRDLSGLAVLSVRVSTTLLGDFQATATFPDGRAMFQSRGNLLSHDFAIQDPSGTEVARIHEAWVDVRDTYRLDIEGGVEPLCALIFAILIDREKKS